MKKLLLFSLALLCFDGALQAGDPGESRQKLNNARREAQEILENPSRLQEEVKNFFDPEHGLVPHMIDRYILDGNRFAYAEVMIGTAKNMRQGRFTGLEPEFVERLYHARYKLDRLNSQTLKNDVLVSSPIFSAKLRELCKEYKARSNAYNAEESCSRLAEHIKKAASAYLEMYTEVML